MRGESPTRAFILYARPDVLHAPASEPFLSSARTLTVSCESAGFLGGAGLSAGLFFSPLAIVAAVFRVSSGKTRWRAECCAPVPTRWMWGGFLTLPARGVAMRMV